MISEKFLNEKFIDSPVGKALRASDGFCEAATYVDEDVFPLVLKIATEEGEFLPCPQIWLDLKNGMLPAAPKYTEEDAQREDIENLVGEVKILAIKKWTSGLTLEQLNTLYQIIGDDGSVTTHGAEISLRELYRKWGELHPDVPYENPYACYPE